MEKLLFQWLNNVNDISKIHIQIINIQILDLLFISILIYIKDRINMEKYNRFLMENLIIKEIWI